MHTLRNALRTGWLAIIGLFFGPALAADAAAAPAGPIRPAFLFDTDHTGPPDARGPRIQAWRRVALDPAYAGAWVIAGDLDRDGAVELVSARNVDRQDVHYTSAVVAQRLDSSVLWRWGERTVGRKKLHHDVACQIYDIWVFNENGRALGQIMTRYARHHALVDWNGDGLEEIVMADARGVFDGHGRRVATFAMPEPEHVADPAEMLVLVGDMTGDGVPDVTLTSSAMEAVSIFRNEQGRKPAGAVPLGSEVNFTLY